jgi:hypothetical protein
MKLLVGTVLILLSLSLHAESREWTSEEKLWGVTAGALLLGDWATTHNMTHRYNENYHENNPLLGQRPTANRVNLYFLTVAPVVFLAADYFRDYRKEILQATSAVELIIIGNNLRIGLHFQF